MIDKLNDKKYFVLFAALLSGLIGGVLIFSPLLNQLERVYNLGHKISYAVAISGVYFTGLVVMKMLVKFKSVKQTSLFVGVFTLILALKLIIFDGETGDYIHYLSAWIDIMREHSFAGAIANKIGNYNMPYLYFLAVLSRFNFYDLYLIKLFSMFFEFICGYYMVKIFEFKSQSVLSKMLLFFGFLLTPTVVLNAAFWGQCDVVYVGFIFAFLYYVFKDKPKLSLIMLALAFSFKLQTVFIMPILIVFVFMKKINWKSLWVFPLTFILTLVPALAFGRSLEQTLSVYISQTSSHTSLTMNAHSIFSLINIGSLPEKPFTLGGILLAGGLTFLLLAYLFLNRKYIDNKEILINACLLFSLMIPFFLPRMHERYFFLADLLAILIVSFNLKKWYIPTLVILSSTNSYCWYLFDGKSLPIQIGAIMIIITMVLVLIEIVKSVRKIKNNN